MTTVPLFCREQFDLLLTEHQQVVESVNNLEYRLYQLGEAPAGSASAECQVAAGALIGQLRKLLFRWDQDVLPTLDSLAEVDDGLPASRNRSNIVSLPP